MLVMPETVAYKENTELCEILRSVTIRNRLIVIVCSVKAIVNNIKLWTTII